jgi:formylglycine-generating enzyme required for sulfatase activity
MMILHGPMEFDRGSPQAEPGRKPGDDEKLQRVRLDQSFAISATAITKEQYLRFRSDYHPEELEPFYPNPNCPVLAVTWFEAAEYCNWLSKQEGIPEKEWCYLPNDAGEFDAGMKLAPDYRHRTAYRLPTEAEWEYACRAGSKTRWYFGSCEEWLSEYAWYAKNAGQRTWPVGQLKPNDFGLFDMHGNSLCWCLDRYASSRKPFQPDDPKEKTIKKEDERILRGGAFVSQAVAVRCASLYRVQPWFPTRDLGFRVVRTWREK